MPREVVHWLVVDRAIEKLHAQEDSELHTFLTQHRDLVLLGSLAHDAPYYFRFGGHHFERVAEKLHGRDGEDTFQPIRELAASLFRGPLSPNEQRMGLAFVFGMLSHISTDIHFHPMVFYFSGNYYHSDKAERNLARARHRLLEVYLDSWFTSEYSLNYDRSISRLLSRVAVSKNIIFSLLEDALPGDMPGRWKASFSYLAWIQNRFISNSWGRLFYNLRRHYPPIFPLESLFSYGRSGKVEALDGSIRFANPVSGESVVASLPELLENAVTQTIDYFRKAQLLLSPQSAESGILKGLTGASLNFGIVGAKPENTKYYSEDALAVPDWGK